MLSFYNDSAIEAGIDESGRGPVFGRLYTAAVIWPRDLNSPLVKDSKKISKSRMFQSYNYVIKNAVAYYIDYATEEEIEKGILKANMSSMHRSVAGLELKYGIKIDHLIVDGNYFQEYKRDGGEKIDHTTVVKGDSKYYSIAAASILAKWTRDNYIDEIANQYPELTTRYDIKNNKGYMSLKHTWGLEKFGYCQFHRKLWKPFLEMPFKKVESIETLALAAPKVQEDKPIKTKIKVNITLKDKDKLIKNDI